MHTAQYVRRKAAGEYLKAKYGFGSEKTLAKLACLGGGPKLDAWALSKIGAPRRSTSDVGGA